jgi:hypothetical protein
MALQYVQLDKKRKEKILNYRCVASNNHIQLTIFRVLLGRLGYVVHYKTRPDTRIKPRKRKKGLKLVAS